MMLCKSNCNFNQPENHVRPIWHDQTWHGPKITLFGMTKLGMAYIETKLGMTKLGTGFGVPNLA